MHSRFVTTLQIHGSHRLSAVGGISLVALLSFVLLSMGSCSGNKTEKLQKFIKSGQTYLDEGDLASASIQLRNAIQLDPKSAQGHYLLSLCYLGQGKAREAFRELSRTVELDPGNRDAQLQLASIYLLARQTKEARDIAKTLLTQNMDDWQGWQLVGNARHAGRRTRRGRKCTLERPGR